jgi:predicted enzyme related to lactoylglutathione lyase
LIPLLKQLKKNKIHQPSDEYSSDGLNTNKMNYKHVISWFEIPATDLERATKFYETIFDVQLTVLDMPEMKMRCFPVADMMNDISGAIVDSNGFHRPSTTDGILIYLNANPDVQLILDKVEAAGGHIFLGKTQISPEHGFMAIIIDTEGNRIGFHSVTG